MTGPGGALAARPLDNRETQGGHCAHGGHQDEALADHARHVEIADLASRLRHRLRRRGRPHHALVRGRSLAQAAVLAACLSTILGAPLPLAAQPKASDTQSSSVPKPIDPKDIADVTLRTGREVSGTVDRLLGSDKNVKAAHAFFAEQRKLKPAPDGYTEFRFRRISTNEHLSAVVITYAETPPRQETFNAVVWAEKVAKQPASTAVRVYATVVAVDGKEPTVKEDYAVVDAKLDATKGRMKEWVKCTLVGCLSAGAGCALGGPSYLGCFSLWCGGGAVGCWLIQLF